MHLEWREPMRIGHAIIDADHKHLIDIINRFEASPDLAHAEKAARDLFQHAHNHFGREEQIQKASAYPLCTLHRIEHEELLNKLKTLIRHHFIECTPTDVETVVAEMRDLIREWFVDHVLYTDLKMKPYIDAMADRTAKV